MGIGFGLGIRNKSYNMKESPHIILIVESSAKERIHARNFE